MADVSVKMGVSGVQQFIQNMNQAGASVKSIDAALKLAEKEFKATGDSQEYLAQKATLLKGKLEQQKKIIAETEKALKQMRDNGADQTGEAYTKLQTKLLKTQTSMMDTQEALNNLGNNAEKAAAKADKLSTSLGGLNKKVSLDQVIRGIDSITGGMEKAAKKAVDLGKAIWENITDSARWADDTATQAMILNMDVEEYQKYKKVFDTEAELTVQEWQKAKLKVQKAINDPTQDQTDILALLGIQTHKGSQGKYGWVEGAARDFEDVFWDIGETLRRKVASGEMTQDLADTYANALFGRGFAELNPIFAMGKTGFAEELAKQKVNTKEEVNALAEYNDKLITLKGDIETLENKITAGFAPALSKAAESIDGLLGRLLEYLDSEEGQQALDDMAKAVEGLFTDLTQIDPEQVIEGFAGIFDKIVSGLQWLENNSGAVIGAMKAIVEGWAALKITDGALKILQLVQGIQGLTGGSAAANAAGKAAGASWGSGFASAVMAAAPWLIGIYTLLNPAETGDDGFRPEVDETGAATQYGMEKLKSMYANPNLTDEQKGMTQWDPAWEVVPFVADVFGQMSDILNDPMAAGAILRFGDDITGLVEALEGLGYEKNMTEDQYSEYMRTRREEANAAEEASGSVETLGDQADTATSALQQVAKEGETTSDDLGDLAGKAEAAAAALGSAASAAYAFGYVPGMSYRHGAGGLGGLSQQTHANGLWYVPFDGYSAILHKGERIMTARENRHYTYNNNTYFGNVNLNNGMEIDMLSESIAKQNRRQQAGYGV